jgi:acyl-CoA thioesterase I
MTDIKSFKVFFFGDSICFGQGISIHKGWVTKLSASLSLLCHELSIPVVFSNTSINGNTTRLALERMPYDVQAQQPDILIMQFGMNDCNYWQTDHGVPRVSPAAFKANLQEIIDRAKCFGVKKIFLNTNHPTTKDKEFFQNTKITYQQSNEIYNKLIREVAHENKIYVELNDIEQQIKTAIDTRGEKLSDLILSDNIHLSEKGHAFYYDIIYPKLHEFITAFIAEPEVS